MENRDKQSVIEKLLQRMDATPGFAGLGASVQTICQLADGVDGGTRKITETILSDAALTAKLLRIANSSANARRGRNISTIDQALAILGLNTVKSVALSLALLSSLSNKPQSNQLHAEIVAAYFCGALAYTVTRLNGTRYSAQEAQVCGLLQNIGRMMATFYLFDDIERSRAFQAENNVSEDEAVLQTLGVGYGDIAAAIVRHWNLPDVLQLSLEPDVGKSPPRSTANAIAWHQLCSLFSRRVTDALFRLPDEREKTEIAHEIEFFRGALHLTDEEVREWIDKALADTDVLLAAIGFPCNVEQARNLLRKASELVMDMLLARDSLTKDSRELLGKSPIEVIQPILRLIHDKYAFDRTLLCLPDGPSRLVAVAGVGRNASRVTAGFRCQGTKPDLFRLIMAKKLDLFIADVATSAYVKLLPDWYQEVAGARSFQVMALVSNGELLGMIYGDYAEPHPSALPNLTDSPMKEWRNQLLIALKSGTPER